MNPFVRHFPWGAPIASGAVLAIALALPPGAAVASLAALALIAGVVAAVHHAEVIAHRTGEPFGTLVLALAVTVIEVALILSMMLAGGEDTAAVPRDTIYAAVMIIANGVVGLCVLVGGISHHEQSFNTEGARSGIAALIALATLSLVMPVFTLSSPEGTYTPAQLAFVATASLALWGVSCSCRPSATATTSSRSRRPPATRRCTWRRPRWPPRGRASSCSWCRWWW